MLGTHKKIDICRVSESKHQEDEYCKHTEAKVEANSKYAKGMCLEKTILYSGHRKERD